MQRLQRASNAAVHPASDVQLTEALTEARSYMFASLPPSFCSISLSLLSVYLSICIPLRFIRIRFVSTLVCACMRACVRAFKRMYYGVGGRVHGSIRANARARKLRE